ncbi:hypothetical protein BGZ46_001010 [Entomortierella lignicola]|nr:hypothetical protein BGZ46_001010 [Entomortierella lignicola]
MKATFVLTALVAVASTVSAYQCPSTSDVDHACSQIDVSPLVCNDPKVNVDVCNAKQCNQAYVDFYAACQCRRTTEEFYQNSKNVQGLLNRCGGSVTNPYGSPAMYRPGEGTTTFPATTTEAPTNNEGGSSDTQIHDGTTYYGGKTSVVDGTTRIVGATAVVGRTTILPDTPAIIGGTSKRDDATQDPQPTDAPGNTPANQPVPPEMRYHPYEITDHHISGGSIAGIVIGLVAMIILAILLGFCWRKVREEHPAVAYEQYQASQAHSNAPMRTTVVEKVEPVVVRTVPN